MQDAGAASAQTTHRARARCVLTSNDTKQHIVVFFFFTLGVGWIKHKHSVGSRFGVILLGFFLFVFFRNDC